MTEGFPGARRWADHSAWAHASTPLHAACERRKRRCREVKRPRPCPAHSHFQVLSLTCPFNILTECLPVMLPPSRLLIQTFVISPCMRAKSLQSCLTLCDPMDCSPAGSSVHEMLPARILEWVAKPSPLPFHTELFHRYHALNKHLFMPLFYHALVIANTLFQQRKRKLYTWTSPDGQH